MNAASPTPPEQAQLEALIGRAQREHRAGRLAEAAAACRQILTLRPDLAEPHNNLGVLLAQCGQFDQAVAGFHQAIVLKPEYVEAHHNLGNALFNLGRLDEAAAALERAIALKPDFVEARYSLAHVLWSQRRLEPAAARFEEVLALRPDLAEAQKCLGDVLWQLGQIDRAAARFERAVALRPDYPEALNNLGFARARQNKLDEAEARFRQALGLRPDFADAHNNLARALLGQRKLDQAAAEFQQVLSLLPDHAEAGCGLASCYLIQGDLRRGFQQYEARLRLAGLPPHPDLPRWNGEPLAGRHLILVGEQGLGDTLQFMRFARVLRSQGARVTLAVQPPLARLLASYPDVDELIVLGPNMEYPSADFYQFLLSLPGLLGTDLASVPAEVPYLFPDAELSARWRQELPGTEVFKIGIVWQVAHDLPPYIQRSVPLTQFAPLAQIPGVQLISLQKGAGSEQIGQVDFPVLDFGNRLDEAAGPFMDTAAIIANLDLVVSVDTSIVHLAGALGAPVFVALHFSSDWRWIGDRDDSPWYPGLRLFRQQAFGQWPDVFERIAQAVAERRAATA